MTTPAVQPTTPAAPVLDEQRCAMCQKWVATTKPWAICRSCSDELDRAGRGQ